MSGLLSLRGVDRKSVWRAERGLRMLANAAKRGRMTLFRISRAFHRSRELATGRRKGG